MPIDQAEQKRRRALIKQHYLVENNHDMDGVMATFAPDGQMDYNRQSFTDLETIRLAHGLIGFGMEGGAIDKVVNQIDAEHFTDDEIVIEGRMCGKHVGEFQGMPATGRDIEMPFVGFYRFDENDKLVSERIVMNLGALL
ncbi:SnoaL-like polyketide cyclase [Rhodobiaceae bacterium]|nr:SnoaL-like polyketide cyclase [Rhodobiaceae bacterium]